MSEGKNVDRSEEEGRWRVEDGRPVKREPSSAYRDDGTENLTYSNPYNLEIERVWFEGHVVFACEQGELDIDLASVKFAEEYQLVYDVTLDDRGKLVGEPERVDGQYNIYDSVPGMDKYSPLWRFNYVIVPRGYEAQTLRSEADCLASGYAIKQSTVLEN